MKHRRGLPREALLVLLFVGGCSSPPAAQRHVFEEAHMGTSVRLVLYAESREHAESGARAVYEEFGRLDAIFSDYDSRSEARLLTERPPETLWPVSAELFLVTRRAKEIWLWSEGAFDITVGPIVRLWRRARRQERLPGVSRLQDALARVGFDKIHLDPSTRSLNLECEGMRLDYGGIAKGYAADRALEMLRRRGIDSALLDAGGDISVSAPPPGRPGWRLEVRPNEHTPPLRGHMSEGAVASSGDVYQFIEIDGQRYSHLIDPKTGIGLTRRVAATVIAPTGMDADAFASALCILGPERGLPAIEELPGIEAHITILENGESRSCVTSGFHAKMAPSSTAERRPAPENGDRS